MAPQIPKLLQPDPGNIYNVVALRYRRVGIRPLAQRRAEGHDEGGEVFVEGKETQELGRRGAFEFGVGDFGRGRGFGVGGHGFGVEWSDFEDVHGNSAFICAGLEHGSSFPGLLKLSRAYLFGRSIGDTAIRNVSIQESLVVGAHTAYLQGSESPHSP